jgi:FkbM family methyltransferase
MLQWVPTRFCFTVLKPCHVHLLQHKLSSTPVAIYTEYGAPTDHRHSPPPREGAPMSADTPPLTERVKQRLSPLKWTALTLKHWTVRRVEANRQHAVVSGTERMEHRHARDQHRETEHIEWLCDRVGDDWLVWDCGAHTGTWTLLLAAHGARVEAVEADPAMTDRLRTNIDLNPTLRDRITVREVAIGGQPGALPIDDLNQWADDERARRQIAVTPASLAAATDTPDAIKMDVEGAELDVLDAMGELLEECQAIVVEVHTDAGVAVAAVRERLTAAGFAVSEWDKAGTGAVHLRGEADE